MRPGEMSLLSLVHSTPQAAHSRHLTLVRSPHTPPSISLPFLAWPGAGAGGLGNGEQKPGLLGNAGVFTSARKTFCPLCSHLGTSERKS